MSKPGLIIFLFFAEQDEDTKYIAAISNYGGPDGDNDYREDVDDDGCGGKHLWRMYTYDYPEVVEMDSCSSMSSVCIQTHAQLFKASVL